MISDLFRYIDEKEALSLGMSHHGSYFLIPIWIGGDDDCILFCTKRRIMDIPFLIIHFFESILLLMFFQEVVAHMAVHHPIGSE
jgi:hypothetical protein